MLRKDIRSQKKQLVAQNLKLTDAEATKFWPIYDQYTAELVKINDKKYATIQEYADRYGTLSDEEAQKLMKQWMEVRRVSLMIELQLASKVPLVQSQ